jgi:hypothetical protein
MVRSEKPTVLALDARAFPLQAGAVLGARTAGGVLRGDDTRCSNDECARRPERGEPYCAPCGLERELFWRYSRFSPQDPHTIR